MEWKQQIQQYEHYQYDVCVNTNTSTSLSSFRLGDTNHLGIATPPCSFAFVAGPAGTHSDPHQFRSFVFPHLKGRFGWKVEIDYQHGYSNSLGLIAFRPNARATLRVTELSSPVQVLTIHYLKSYGEKWMNSTLFLELYVTRGFKYKTTTTLTLQPELITSWSLSGYHTTNTSVSHVYRIDIGTEKAAQVGDEIDLQLQLVNGTNFKIRSLLMCRH